eukprot:13070586-Alexandrium_andersonii.AAC.1
MRCQPHAVSGSQQLGVLTTGVCSISRPRRCMKHGRRSDSLRNTDCIWKHQRWRVAAPGCKGALTCQGMMT